MAVIKTSSEVPLISSQTLESHPEIFPTLSLSRWWTSLASSINLDSFSSSRVTAAPLNLPIWNITMTITNAVRWFEATPQNNWNYVRKEFDMNWDWKYLRSSLWTILNVYICLRYLHPVRVNLVYASSNSTDWNVDESRESSIWTARTKIFVLTDALESGKSTRWTNLVDKHVSNVAGID